MYSNKFLNKLINEEYHQYVFKVDIGMAADVGTLQRLPKVIGNDSLVRELCYTARKFKSEEAALIGLVSKVFPDKERWDFNECFLLQYAVSSLSDHI